MKVAERSGQLIGELVPAIRKTAELVQEVAAASAEQSAGVVQVSKAMGTVDQVTQRNASASEELSSTAEEMASQAESLQQLMGFFVLSAHSGAAPRAVASQPHGVAPAGAAHPGTAAHAQPLLTHAAIASKTNGASGAGGFKRF